MPWPKGKPRSEETKQKISAWNQEHAPMRGRHLAPETRALISAAMSRNLQGNKRRLGIPHDEETRRRMSEASRANWGKDEYRNAARQWWADLTPDERRAITRSSVEAMTTPDARRRGADSRRGKPMSASCVEAIRTRMAGEGNPMFGKRLSEERKRQSSLPGPLNPRWKGGVSRFPYPIEFDHALKERIRDRDGRTCQLCGKPESECGRRLDIHHIDHNKANLADGNLLALCRGCNSRVNTNADHWQQHFEMRMAEASA